MASRAIDQGRPNLISLYTEAGSESGTAVAPAALSGHWFGGWFCPDGGHALAARFIAHIQPSAPALPSWPYGARHRRLVRHRLYGCHRGHAGEAVAAKAPQQVALARSALARRFLRCERRNRVVPATSKRRLTDNQEHATCPPGSRP